MVTISSFPAPILKVSGKSESQLDAVISEVSQQLVTDMRQGITSYSTIAQPNFFEAKAAELLERFAGGESASLQQTVGLGPFQPVDLSGFDEVKNYAYPAEVKVIDGKTYVVHRNCTEATKLSGYGGSAQLIQGFHGQGQSSIPLGSTTTTITRKKTIHDWVRENMEPSVVGYNSVVNVGGQGRAGHTARPCPAPDPSDKSALHRPEPAPHYLFEASTKRSRRIRMEPAPWAVPSRSSAGRMASWCSISSCPLGRQRYRGMSSGSARSGNASSGT